MGFRVPQAYHTPSRLQTHVLPGTPVPNCHVENPLTPLEHTPLNRLAHTPLNRILKNRAIHEEIQINITPTSKLQLFKEAQNEK
eukprot:Pgem_evm1s14355